MIGNVSYVWEKVKLLWYYTVIIFNLIYVYQISTDEITSMSGRVIVPDGGCSSNETV